MLHLIKMWLEARVEETDELGNKRRSTRNRDEGRGTPQGSPISPLLSNLYMRRFVLGWKKLGHEKRWKAHIVNYADDLVICCRVRAQQALAETRVMMSRLKLTVNEKKTRICYLPEKKFDFLGYTFGRNSFLEIVKGFEGTLESIRHDYDRLTFISSADYLVVEGTSQGRMSGKSWAGGKTPGGRFCNVFKFRDGRIANLHIYLDPDYTGEDEARFRWGKDRQW